VTVDLRREQVQDAPPYDASQPFGRDSEGALYGHYSRNGEVWPRLTEIAAQFKARLAGAGQQRPAHMVQRGGYARKVFHVDRVVFAALDMPAMMQALQGRERIDHPLRFLDCVDAEDFRRVVVDPDDRVVAGAHAVPMRTTSLPKFPQVSMPMNASGAFVRPSMTSSRYLIFPAASHGLIAATNSD
jgi:hypothetical protein